MRKKMSVLVFSVALSIHSLAFAAVPDNSIVVGNKAFSTELLFTKEGMSEINTVLAQQPSDAKIYFNQEGMVGSGKFKDIFDLKGSDITREEIAKWPQITYKDSLGNTTEYAPGNGLPVDGSEEGFAVIDIQ